MAVSTDDILHACGSKPVCLYDGASISNASELQKALPEGVSVVVIPQPDQAENTPTSALANGILKATDADTVIMIEDRSQDRFSVASDQGNAKAITEALYSQSGSDGGVAVVGIADTLASAERGSGAGDSDGGGLPVGGILSGVIAVVVVAGGVGTWVSWRRRRSAKRTEKMLVSNRRLEKDLEEALNGEDGEFVLDALEELEGRANALPDLSGLVRQLHTHLSDLFVRVRKRGTDQQVRLLQAQYKDTLQKLLKALGDDYYGDIVQNPHYWSRPVERTTEVRQAVASVDQQAVENIRQVNESRDLDFQVALDSLIKTVDEAKLSDVYSDRETE